MLKDAPLTFTFDDFVLIPKFSDITSRRLPELNRTIAGIEYKIPFFAAPMNTVCEQTMANCMAKLGAGAVIHRYMSIEEQVIQYQGLTKEAKKRTFFAVGASKNYFERAQGLYDAGVRNFCVDVANGYSVACINAVYKLYQNLSDVVIMAGNVADHVGVGYLINAGAKIIRCGIGPGSFCTTRQITGHGVPQLSALESCVLDKENDCFIIADGGIRNSGDIVKCFAIGADAVMMGGLLAASSATPGELINDGGGMYKYGAGMASEKAREDWFDRDTTSFVPEGVSYRIPYKGSTEKIINDLANGLKVGMSYSGAENLYELKRNARFIRVTDNGRREGNPNGKLHKE